MTPASTLVTRRLTLRRPQAGDLPAYAAYCASDRARFAGGPVDAAGAFETFAALVGHWVLRGFGRYVMDRGGQPIGHVGPLAAEDRDRPELTWTLWDGAHEGQGYATEAARAVALHLLDDLRWPDLAIHVAADNAAARRLAERLGAEPAPAGKAGVVSYRLGLGAVA